MKIRPRNIPIFQNGKNLWYQNLIGKDYDDSKYLYNYDTSQLVDGDMKDEVFNPWVSNTAGYDKGRYVPTNGHGNFGIKGEHYNYTLGVEGQDYYKKFGNDLLDENGNFTEMGKAWAKSVDSLIPQSNHLARFYDDNGNLRTSWSTGHNDAHGRAPKTYNNLKDYVKAIRNDQILGARHNVFLNRGKRYFYKDKDGIEHWVDPNEVGNYTVTKDPVRSNWNNDHTIYWDDYELTGPTGSSVTPGNPDSVTGEHKEKYGFDWNKLKEGLQKAAPNLLAAGRLAYSLDTNRRMYQEQLKGIKPQLQGSYHTHRQVVGDEATKQAYYRRAAQGQTRAARPFTSDADRQMAYQMEARRVGDELRSQGDLADNQEIRRTSDESNQHQWQNKARDNQVANANYLALIQANAQRHQLKSNYLAANHSSWNNYLLEKESRMRQRQAENQALEDQIYALDAQNKLANDPTYQGLYDNMSDAYDKALEKNKDANGNYNYTAARNDPEFRKAQQEYQNAQYRMQRQQYVDMLNRRSGRFFFGKDGMKIQFKKKDDLLYKTARDAVEHYRKMVKMTDDSTLKSFKKPLNVIKPPKSTTRKMQTGGVAPFVVYTPAPIGGETTTSTQASGTAGIIGKGSSKKDGDSTLDIIKDLFKNLEGLPSDVNGVYQSMSGFLARAKAFGNELSSDDLASMYLAQMQQINNIKFSKAAYDKAKEQATSNDALNEFAVNSRGQIAVQKKDGSLDFMSWKEIKESGEVNPLTNNDLLNLRAYTTDLRFQDQLFNVVNNGIGVNKIAEFIKAQLPKLGSNEQTIEGYTKKQSNQIRQGFEQLLQDAPDGNYHYSRKTEDQKQQIQMALGYIKTILPRNMQTILGIHADLQGVSSDVMLQALLGAEGSETKDLKLTAVTGKAAKDTNGNSKSGENDMTPAMAFFMGQGERSTFFIQDKTSDTLKIKANSMPLLDENGHGLGNATLQQVSNGQYIGQLDWNSATMGDVKISPNGTNHVLVSGGKIYSTELPIDKQAAAAGIIKPDLKFLKQKEKADEELRQLGINDIDNLSPDQIKTINRIYNKHNLPVIYKEDGTQELTGEYRRFAMVHGTATANAFEGDMNFNDGAKQITDSKARSQYESMMRTVLKDPKFTLDNPTSVFGVDLWGGDDLYEGTIYIPMVNDTISALGGTGYKAKPSEYNDIDKLQQQANAARKMNFKPGGNASSL